MSELSLLQSIARRAGMNVKSVLDDDGDDHAGSYQLRRGDYVQMVGSHDEVLEAINDASSA